MTREEHLSRLRSADIYGITANEYSRGRGTVETVRQMIAAGITVIQYREKDLKPGKMYEECLAIKKLTVEAGVTFIVNDFADLAILVEADGVHIGQDDLPPAKVRKLVGPDMIIGLSTHSPAQAHAAAADGIVDYIGVGPIFPTSTKKDACASVGLEYLRYVVNNIRLPLVAIGGIKEDNISQVKEHGAQTIALISEIVGAEDIPAKVRKLRATMTGA